MIAFLSGKKTYIVAGLLVLISVVKMLAGDVSIEELLNSPDLLILLNGLGLAALRGGISKS